ncbi:hypothetical protein GCM10028806_59630 [Spirosoma terrae]|uniref:T9SS type A sorting domain-containing protein n=1 Tax=Spirosoma terrae TaxID=1968276 RepID=A0A6L9LGF2_9BACT|nr:T9SS type A sorting domain-containing protein [Spirosoma terrae]NDU98432.1 T9SS type A sorting domain-containing protein [Spirosoma terrae]
MRWLFAIFLLVLATSQLIFAQYTSLRLSTPALQICKGADFTFNFFISGNSEPATSYRLQIRSANANAFQDIPGAITASPATIRLPDDLVIGQSYSIRLVSSTQVYSDVIGPLVVKAAPTAQLIGSTADTTIIVRGESTQLKILLTGGEPYVLRINDSLRFEQVYAFNTDNSFRVLPEKTTTYRLTSVQNACGSGEISGSTTVNVSALGFRFMGYQSFNFCPGDTIYPEFSTSTSLDPSTQFSVDWIQNDGKVVNTTQASFREHSLIIPTPKSLINSYTNGLSAPYRLVVRNTTLAIRATLPNVNLKPTPTLQLITTSLSVPFGHRAVLYAQATNASGATLIMQDSTTVPLIESLTTGSHRFFLQPTKTAEYSVKQIYTGYCPASVQSVGKINISVTPGIRLDSVSRNHVCAGDEISLFYTSNFTVSQPASAFVVEAGTVGGDGKLSVNATFQVLRIEANRFVLKIPNETAPAIYSLQIRRLADTLLSSIVNGVYVNTLPTASHYSGSQNLAKPGLYSMYVTTTGGTDGLEITLSDGTWLAVNSGLWSNKYDYTFSIQVPSTNVYAVKSVRNQCGVGKATGSVNLAVTSPVTPILQLTSVGPRLEIPSQAVLCASQLSTVQFANTGPWASNVTYKVEISESNSQWSGWYVGSGSTSPISIQLPSFSGYFRLRVVADNGIISNEVTVSVSPTFASGQLSLYYTPPLIGSQQGSSVVISSYPKSEVYLNSSVYSVLIGASSGALNNKWLSYNYSLGEPDRPVIPTNYTIKAVSKSCIQQFSTNTASVQIAPFLFGQRTVSTSYCPGNKIVTIPYVAIGIIPATTRFVIDVVDERNTTRSFPATGGPNYVQALIDNLIPEKEYTFQLKAILANQQTILARKDPSPYSDKLRISSPSSVSLTGERKQTVVEIQADQSTLLYFNASRNVSAVLSDGRFFDNTSGSGFSVQPTRTTNYRIHSAWNECGFIEAATSVTVRVLPGLRSFALSSGNICRGQTMPISFHAVGDFEAGHKLGIFLQLSGSDYWLKIAETTALDFNQSVTLPNSLQSGRYKVKVESISLSSVRLSKEIGFVSITSRPAVALSGTVTAYANDFVRFSIPNSGGDAGTVVLLGGSRPITAQIADNQLQFNAVESATYRITEIANSCGVGEATGSITVKLLSNANQTLRIVSAPSILCAGQTAPIRMSKTGSYGSTNRFTVQLSDSTGNQFKPLLTTANGESLTVVIPADMPSGTDYRLRVVSSDPVIEGASSQQFIQLSSLVSGTLTGSNSVLKGDTSVLTLRFNGLPPWQYELQNEFGSLVGQALSSPHYIRLPVDTSSIYKLVGVSTQRCGVGQAYGEAVLTVSPLTVAEPLSSASLEIYPNPTVSSLSIRLKVLKTIPVMLTVRDVTGKTKLVREWPKVSDVLEDVLSMNDYPSGIYFIELVSGATRSTYKVIKN